MGRISMKRFGILILFIMLISANLIVSAKNTQPILVSDNSGVGSQQLISSSDYLNYTQSGLVLFTEDLKYASWFRKELFNKNMTLNEAMTSALSLYTIVSQELNDINSIKPPLGSDYQLYQQEIVQSLVNFKNHLWFMLKFLETDNIKYFALSQNFFNKSMNHYNAAVSIGKNLTSPLIFSTNNKTILDSSKLNF